MNRTENSDVEKSDKNGGEVDLTPEYSGVSREFTAETGEPAPLRKIATRRFLTRRKALGKALTLTFAKTARLSTRTTGKIKEL